jgi:predicted HicB family RNase H-like nuclease
MSRSRKAPVKPAYRHETSIAEISAGTGNQRMVDIRVSSELHRKLRLIVAAQDTSLQEWIAQTLEDAVRRAWPGTGNEAAP